MNSTPPAGIWHSGNWIEDLAMTLLSCRIWKQLDQLMANYPITETPQLVTRDMFGCALYPSVDNTVQSFSPSLGDSIELIAATTPNLTITLPETLTEDAGISVQSSLAFCGYKSEALFVRRENYLLDKGRDSLQLSSGIVSVNPSLREGEVNGLSENVMIVFVKNMVSSLIESLLYML